MMRDGLVRVAAASPQIKVADCNYNVIQIEKILIEAENQGVHLLVLPELCLTGYTCGDLFLSRVLLQAAEQAITHLISFSENLDLIFTVGLPVAVQGQLYNTAAVIKGGKLLGLVPKQNIPNYAEFYELRHFTPFTNPAGAMVDICFAGQTTCFGQKILFACSEVPEFKLAVEICEDLWVPQPPSIVHAQAGATVIANLSASDEIIGKADYRRLLVQSQSARLICGYVYADAGIGESTTDLVFAGHNLIYENGHRLAEAELFTHDMISVDHVMCEEFGT